MHAQLVALSTAVPANVLDQKEAEAAARHLVRRGEARIKAVLAGMAS